MAVPTQLLHRLSYSAQRAVRWAIAAAAHREGLPPGSNGPPINEFDLLIGVLLAHPDSDGEAWVLLDHFGLTARDVLPADYPTVSGHQLQRRADAVSASTPPVLSTTVSVVFDEISSSVDGEVKLYHVLGGMLKARTELWTPLMSALSAVGESIDALAASYGRWVDSKPDKEGIAGQSLRQWLREHNPRQPVDIPTYASDQVDAGHDLIGIAAEADAFAYLLSAKELRPPLAIGLFGDWGSGKSFLMQAIRYRIDTLTDLVADREQDQAPIWKQTKQIDFNAWEYVQGDLWAGLLERIFRELGSVSEQANLVATVRKPLQDELCTEKKQIEQVAIGIGKLETDEGRLACELEQKRKTAEDARREAPAKTRQLLTQHGEQVVRDALGKVWGEQRLRMVGKEGIDLLDALGEAKVELKRAPSLLGPYWHKPWRIIALTLAAAAVPLVAYLLVNVIKAPPLVSLLGGLAALVPVATGAVRAATGWTHQRLAELERAETAIREGVEQDMAAKANDVAEAERALEEARRILAAERRRRDALAQHSADLGQRIVGLTPARVLVEFADERSSDYRRQLGLLSTVRHDLTKIQNQLRDNNSLLVAGSAGGDPSVPNRIVLYIDDLDRCPPAKVVEVLEAVHLLLAFEMFVVVVAVDTRWLSSALKAQLTALTDDLADGDRPTPRDYMEKIFQLPYWVQPLTDEARSNLVRGLLAASVRPADSGTSGPSGPADLQLGEAETKVLKAMLEQSGSALRLETSQLALTSDDVQFVQSLAPLVGDTPRRVKRFVNTCQLLLAMRPPLPPGAMFPSQRQIVCLLAAMNAGAPDTADEIFDAAESGAQGTLGSLAVDAAEADAAKWEPLRRWLDRNPAWKTVPLSSLSVRLDMVKRLRFQPPARAARP